MICFIDEQHMAEKFNRTIFIALILSFISFFTMIFQINPKFDSSYLIFINLIISTLLLSIYVFLKNLNLTIKIDDKGFHYKYHIFKTTKKTINYNQINSYTHDTLESLYKFKYKKNNHFQEIIIDGNDLLVLNLKNNKQLILSTKNIDFLIDTLSNYI